MTNASPRPASDGPAAAGLPPIYPIIDVDLCRLRGLDPLRVAQGCFDGGARLLQVRQKSRDGGSAGLLALVRQTVELAGRSRARVVVNDRADIAMLSGAGVHVGQQDLPPGIVRRLVGKGVMVGVSTHDREQIDGALEGPADYVAVGPIFVTSTKDTGYEPRGLEMIRYAAQRGKPVVAIGGITAERAPAVLAAGATSVAVISDLLSNEDPAIRVRQYLRALHA